jgi:hypothetical protein
MLRRGLSSPVLLAFLRALAFVGITETVFYRLMPAPAPSATGLLAHLHASLNSAGNLTFHLAFFVVTLALIHLAYRTLQLPVWPRGLNAFLALSFLFLSALGVTAFTMGGGPGFAILFTLVSLTTVLLLAMHAFSIVGSSWFRAFAICYCGALVCSAAGTIARLAGDMTTWREAGERLHQRALSGGELLLVAAGLLSFMSCYGLGRPSTPRARQAGPSAMPLLLGSLVGAGFAAGCLLAPVHLALLGPAPGAVRVTMLSAALFLATTTTAASLFEPGLRLQGYGLLLLLLAGFPLRIAYQDLLVVLGAALLFAPAPVEESHTVTVDAAGPLDPPPPEIDPAGPLPVAKSESG